MPTHRHERTSSSLHDRAHPIARARAWWQTGKIGGVVACWLDADRLAGAYARIDEQVSRLGLAHAGDGSSAYAPVVQPPPTAPGGPQHDTGAVPTGCLVNPAQAEGAHGVMRATRADGGARW